MSESIKPKLNNAEIADRLLGVAQLLAARGENPFKVRAYRRAAELIKGLSESVDQLVREGADLTIYSGIGKAISSAVREIVLSGSLGQLEKLRADLGPEAAALSEHPRLNPKQVLRAYKKLGVASIAGLKAKLASGEVDEKLGARLAQHFRSAFADSREILLFDADSLVPKITRFLRRSCGASQVEVTGAFRRRLEVVAQLSFLLATDDFAKTAVQFHSYGGRSELLSSDAVRALFRLPLGITVLLENVPSGKWGVGLVAATGSDAHVEKLEGEERRLSKLARDRKRYTDEAAVYRGLGLAYIEPELREGLDELERAARGEIPRLVTARDIRGDLHAHSTSSDGVHSIEAMAAGARERGDEFIGITDHSQSLKIARGVSISDLRAQIRRIDKLNSRLRGFRILKSAEVDILADGSLDYPDDLLRELDYTVCSIHSRFALNKDQQTERILRAIDNPYFTILGHATGRRLLQRPGYEIDIGRVVEHAKQAGCFFEINANPIRLDLRPEHARIARAAGIKIAINTDAHSLEELDYLKCGIDQARRAGLESSDVLNTRSWPELERLFHARR
jgi:DNA polymerase (family 10)